MTAAKMGAAAIRLLAMGLVLVGLLAASLHTSAQDMPANTPVGITAPAGNMLVLKTRGTGTQDYVCLPSATGGAWTFERPQASLFVTAGGFTFEAAEHFLSAVPKPITVPDPACTASAAGGQEYCPTWRSPLDQSAVWGEKVASIAAGSSADCPNTGAIACLLLKSVATSNGQSDHGLFAAVTFIARADTEGGNAPATSCRIGQIAQVPYGADYLFYEARH